MGLCVCARILNHNMVKYTLQLCRKEMTVVMEFLVGNFKLTNIDMNLFLLSERQHYNLFHPLQDLEEFVPLFVCF